MTQEKAKKIRFLYGLLQSALLICTGICLIVACVSIYRSGDAPFTRESIGTWLGRFAVPLALTVAAILGGIVLSLVLPCEEVRLRGIRDGRVQLKKLRERLDLAKCDRAVFVRLEWELLCRRMLLIGALALSVLALIPLAICLNSPDSFTPALNESVIGVTLAALPFATVTGGAAFAYLLLEAQSLARETALVKQAIASGAARKPAETVEESKTLRATLVIRLGILAVAVVLIVLGVFNGGMRDTLGKAIKICTECIGLG